MMTDCLPDTHCDDDCAGGCSQPARFRTPGAACGAVWRATPTMATATCVAPSHQALCWCSGTNPSTSLCCSRWEPLSPYLGKIIMYPSASLCCSRWEKGKIVSLSPGLGNDIMYSGIHTSANSGCSRWEESENATLSPDLGNDTVYSGTNSSANSGCAVWESHAVPWSCSWHSGQWYKLLSKFRLLIVRTPCCPLILVMTLSTSW